MGSSAADLTSRVLRHERLLVVGSVVVLTALTWTYLVRDIPMGMMQPPLTTLIAMWWLMMLAMMLPSATPAILLYSRVRQMRGGNAPIAQPWVFLSGYLAVWLLFSIAAALVQSQLADSSMAVRGNATQAAVLFAAGAYQLSPLKAACLSQCRSPGQFISRHWRPGWDGAVRLGLLHGAYCVGCCWMLMTLLFVGGVMNLIWVVALTVLVAAEKLLPARAAIPIISGLVLIAWGLLRALQM